MGIKLRKHPLKLKALLFSCMIFVGILSNQSAIAEDINIPIKRVVATQPVTKLEIISIVKSLLSGRILNIRKLSSYNNPDCHHVKLLEDKGEFQIIKLGCYIDSIVQINKKPASE